MMMMMINLQTNILVKKKYVFQVHQLSSQDKQEKKDEEDNKDEKKEDYYQN